MEKKGSVGQFGKMTTLYGALLEYGTGESGVCGVLCGFGYCESMDIHLLWTFTYTTKLNLGLENSNAILSNKHACPTLFLLGSNFFLAARLKLFDRRKISPCYIYAGMICIRCLLKTALVTSRSSKQGKSVQY